MVQQSKKGSGMKRIIDPKDKPSEDNTHRLSEFCQMLQQNFKQCKTDLYLCFKGLEEKNPEIGYGILDYLPI